MKKKRFWGILLLTLLLNMVGTKVFAHDIAVANDDGVTIYYYWTNNHTELEVSYRGSHYDDYSNEYTGNIVIPESVVYEGNTYPVTRIGFHAFQYCSGLASITIPNSVSSIGDDAFFGTAWYKNQPNGLVYAGNVAYRYKGTMPPKTHVEIKEGTLGISDFAFEGCSGLISISIPSSVTNIGENAFVSCSGLEKVIVKDIAAWCEISFCYGIYGHYSNPLSYAHHLYSDEDTEITDLIIPNNVTVVSNWAFDGCSSLTSVTIPNSVTTIGNDAFSGCSGLEKVIVKDITAWCGISFGDINSNPLSYAYHLYSDENTEIKDVVIPNSMTSIGNYAFSGCSGMTSITIPNTVTSIGEYAFYNCSGLTSITIPNSVTSISNEAFYNCSGLTSITIPNSVTSIGESTFSGCSGLTSVTFHCCEIGSWFRGLDNIQEVMIGDEVTSIGNSAFSGCSGLTKVYFNATNCTEMGDYWDPVFENCFSLTTLHIGDNVQNIPAYAFFGCSGLTSVTIPNSVTSIGNYAFYKCSGLQSVVVGNGVTSLPDWVFSTGKSLKSLTIGVGVLSISSYAFRYNDSSYNPIKTIWLTNTPPNGYSYAAGKVNYVANDQYTSLNNKTVYPFLSSMFKVDGIKYVPVSPSERTCDAIDCVYDNSAQNTRFGDAVTYNGITMNVNNIQPYVCYGNSYIKNVQFDFSDEKKRDIPAYAFDGCSSLEKIDIPNAVKTMGEYAFYGCSKMESVKMGTGIKNINTYTFADCSALSTIEIPKSVTDIKDYAFYGCNSLKTVIMEVRSSILNLGSNGSSPLFSSCPLNYVYIGGNISYNTSSNRGYSPFYRNTSLQTVIITDKETEISDNEFYGCTNLKNVSIGDDVTTIGNWAFSGCSNLDHFAFGSNLQTIGKEAFSDCVAVTRIISRAPNPPVCGTQALDDINKWTCTLEVPEGRVATYQTADQWKEFFFIKEGNGNANFYRLTYLIDGEEYKTYEFWVGDAITPEAEPIKEGYTFSGWSEIPEVMPAHDVTVTGSFSINTYKLTYLIDGEEYKSYELEYGAAITPEAEPAKEGYTFSGWSDIPETMPAYDVTVTGTFSINSYKLTYMIDDVVYKEVVYEYGATITPEPQPDGDYISFEWVGLPETMPANDVTVYAVYETGILDIMTLQGIKAVYSPNGKKLDKLQKGLNIVVMQDGTIRKVKR